MQRCVAAYVAATCGAACRVAVGWLTPSWQVHWLCLHTQSDERKERKKKKEIAQHTID